MEDSMEYACLWLLTFTISSMLFSRDIDHTPPPHPHPTKDILYITVYISSTNNTSRTLQGNSSVGSVLCTLSEARSDRLKEELQQNFTALVGFPHDSDAFTQ